MDPKNLTVNVSELRQVIQFTNTKINIQPQLYRKILLYVVIFETISVQKKNMQTDFEKSMS